MDRQVIRTAMVARLIRLDRAHDDARFRSRLEEDYWNRLVPIALDHPGLLREVRHAFANAAKEYGYGNHH
jgi:hypothetical protein